MQVRTWMCLVVPLLAVVRVQPVQACSCALDVIQVRPAIGETGVPRNTRIWVPGGMDYLPVLEDAGGGTVELTRSQVQASSGFQPTVITVLTPVRLLDEGHTYLLRIGYDVRFTAGAAVLSELPAKPSIHRQWVNCPRNWKDDDGDSCGGRPCYANLEFSGTREFLLVDADRQGTFDPQALTGSVTVFTKGSRADIGDSACTANWDGAKPGATAHMRYGTLDLAGNFSGWREEDVTMDDGSCACPTAQAEGPAWGAALLLLPGLRRRRGKVAA